jgi:hypothetical protein
VDEQERRGAALLRHRPYCELAKHECRAVIRQRAYTAREVHFLDGGCSNESTRSSRFRRCSLCSLVGAALPGRLRRPRPPRCDGWRRVSRRASAGGHSVCGHRFAYRLCRRRLLLFHGWLPEPGELHSRGSVCAIQGGEQRLRAGRHSGLLRERALLLLRKQLRPARWSHHVRLQPGVRRAMWVEHVRSGAVLLRIGELGGVQIAHDADVFMRGDS